MAPLGCGAMVRDAGERCGDCHPLACPDSDGVPLAPVEDDDTSAVRTVRLPYEPIGTDGLGDVRARRAA